MSISEKLTTIAENEQKVYEAGYSPICPKLMHYGFLKENVPQEHKDRLDMAAELLRRCRIVVVCGAEVDEQVKNDIALAALQENLPGAWTENTRGYRIKDGLFLEWGDRFEWPDQNAPEGDDHIYCHGLQDHFGILCDGTVVPCCLDSEGGINLGNIFREELTDILASPRATAIKEGFRSRKATENLCRRCGYARRF